MADMPQTDGQEIMRLFINEITRRLREDAKEMKAADFEMVRKLLADNSVTIASVARGDYGSFAKGVAESFPFAGDEGEDGSPRFTQ
jgi:hypothetical protein